MPDLNWTEITQINVTNQYDQSKIRLTEIDSCHEPYRNIDFNLKKKKI